MTRRLIRSVVALFLVAFPAAAQEVDCSTAMDTYTLNQCALDELESADAELNAVYKRVLAVHTRLDADLPKELGGAVATLRDAQRHWIAFRDKACEAEGFAYRGGSAESLLVLGCKRVLTEERINHLKGMLEMFDG